MSVCIQRVNFLSATFRELGPPDLCHTVKSPGRTSKDVRSSIFVVFMRKELTCYRFFPQEQLGTYHYVSGVDASSSASLAAYLNSLTYAVEDNAAWFSKSTAFKVRNGCYWLVFHFVACCRVYHLTICHQNKTKKLFRCFFSRGCESGCQDSWWCIYVRC